MIVARVHLCFTGIMQATRRSGPRLLRGASVLAVLAGAGTVPARVPAPRPLALELREEPASAYAGREASGDAPQTTMSDDCGPIARPNGL